MALFWLFGAVKQDDRDGGLHNRAPAEDAVDCDTLRVHASSELLRIISVICIML